MGRGLGEGCSCWLVNCVGDRELTSAKFWSVTSSFMGPSPNGGGGAWEFVCWLIISASRDDS